MKPSDEQRPLSESQRRLLLLIQEIHYGRIEGFSVRGGEPVLEQTTRVVRDVKLGGPRRPRSVLVDHGFRARPQVREMLGVLQRLGDGFVQVLEVHDGLPFRLSIEETLRS